jgi:hypothetical protein
MHIARLWLAAIAAAAAGWGMRELVATRAPIALAIVTVIPFGLVYFAMTAALGVPEGRELLSRVRARRRG